MSDQYRDFYVYVAFRLNGVPCYVGKGKSDRWKKSMKRSCNSRLRRIVALSGGELPVVIIRSGLFESEAFETEIALIAVIGRGDSGPLVNMTDGGDGTAGYRRTEQECTEIQAYWNSPEGLARKAKQSAAAREVATTPEAIAAMSVRMKGNTFGVGYKHTEETKKKVGPKIAEANRKRITTEATRKKRSDAFKARWADQKQREKLQEAQKAWAQDNIETFRQNAPQHGADGRFLKVVS